MAAYPLIIGFGLLVVAGVLESDGPIVVSRLIIGFALENCIHLTDVSCVSGLGRLGKSSRAQQSEADQRGGSLQLIESTINPFQSRYLRKIRQWAVLIYSNSPYCLRFQLLLAGANLVLES